jgi:hypothetical protein
MSLTRLLADGLFKAPLTEPPPPRDLTDLGERFAEAARRRLGRSLSIRQVDAGSCNACELEIHALANAYYDLERFGLRFVASPRHADVLLVTGPVTLNMRQALERTWAATPAPPRAHPWLSAVAGGAAGGFAHPAGGLARRAPRSRTWVIATLSRRGRRNPAQHYTKFKSLNPSNIVNSTSLRSLKKT